MRIDIVKPYHYTEKIFQKDTSNNLTVPVMQSFEYKPGLIVPPGYFVSFRGYSEDREFITFSKDALDNTMQGIVDYYSQGNPDFEDALNILYERDSKLYEKVTSSVQNFKTIETDFNIFNATILEAVKDIRYNRAQLGNFWVEHSFVGDKKTSDIIGTISENNQNQDVNDIINKMDYDKYEELKQNLITEWFKGEINLQTTSENQIDKDNRRIYKILEKRWGTANTRRFLKEQESYYTNEFSNATIDKILTDNLPKEKKCEGVNALLTYLGDMLRTEDSKSLDKHLTAILEVKHHLKRGIDKEMMKYVKDDFKTLHKIAVIHWKQNSLPKLINNSLAKALYIDNAEKEHPVILTIPGYSELSLNQKFFTAKYYSNNNNALKGNNMLQQIIQDRDIKDPSVIIDTISLKIESDRQKYFNQLDTFYDYLKDRQENKDWEIPEISIPHRREAFSFIDNYLFVLNKFEDFCDKSASDKLEYLSTLTREELLLANNLIKRQWDKEELQYLIETEVRHQATNTSINSQMYEELKKINVNLDDIKIKIDNIPFSIQDLIDNKSIIKDENEIKKVMQNSSRVFADAERAYFSKTPSEQDEIDYHMKETMPLIIDNLIEKTDDKDIIEKLTFIKTKCKEPRTKANEVINMLKTIAVAKTMNIGFHKGFHTLGHLLPKSGHHLMADAGNISDQIMQNADSGIDAMHLVAGGAANHAALGGSSGLGFSSIIPTVDPATAAIIAIGAAIVSVSVSVARNKATKLERQQRELYVDFSY